MVIRKVEYKHVLSRERYTKSYLVRNSLCSRLNSDGATIVLKGLLRLGVCAEVQQSKTGSEQRYFYFAPF